MPRAKGARVMSGARGAVESAADLELRLRRAVPDYRAELVEYVRVQIKQSEKEIRRLKRLIDQQQHVPATREQEQRRLMLLLTRRRVLVEVWEFSLNRVWHSGWEEGGGGAVVGGDRGDAGGADSDLGSSPGAAL